MSTVVLRPRWLAPREDRRQTRELADSLGVSGVVAQLLYSRGCATVDQGREFLESHRQPLTDPFSLSDMDKAVDRLHHARTAGQHVRVFGDYDVDGISATALLIRALKRFGIQTTSFAVPDRFSEGYGLSPQSVGAAARDGVDLIVTVDNGISAYEAAEAAKTAGVDLIVTDHHVINGDLPEACAVINPKRDDPESPFAEACGSAVAFKLATALNGEPSDFNMVALATVADVVALRGENRQLVIRGLREVAEGNHVGLDTLVRKVGLRPRDIRAEHVAFQIAPRINASGRLGSGMTALELFMTDSAGEAERLALQLDTLNTERREIESGIFETARAEAERYMEADPSILVLAHEGWHPGVIGIVASRIQHAFWRPTILIALDDAGLGRGSARSTPGFDMVGAIGTCEELLVRYGGHRAAAGLTIQADNVSAFRERIVAEAGNFAPPGDGGPEFQIDALLALSDIDADLLGDIDKLEPFGHENPAPVFATYGASLAPGSVRELRGGHLKCTVQQGSRAFPAIGFNLAASLDLADIPEEVDVAFRPKFNTFRGETTIQLHLKDIRPTT